MKIDARLQLAMDLYEPCALGCDIGTDHGLLPCRLLKENICRSMILSDISEKALSHARQQVKRQRLEDRAFLVCGDGLDVLPSKNAPVFGEDRCGCVSVTGMGGETVAAMLQNRPERLQGAVLVLSVHTEQSLVRLVLKKIGYRITREQLAFDRGRFYVVWRAEPGEMQLTDEEIRFGTPLLFEPSPLLIPYLQFRLNVFEKQLAGLRASHTEIKEALSETEAILAFYRQCLSKAEKREPNA